MLDLFSGTGSASAPMREAGWEVVRVELDPAFDAEVTADVLTFEWRGGRPDLLWASPPCTDYARESMPWCRTGKTPDPACVERVHELVEAIQPRYWVLENVRGAVPYLGKPVRRVGPTYLWGRFPFFLAEHVFWKEKLSSKDVMRRSMIPRQIAEGLRLAIEAETKGEAA